eukprot:CAMPEP_0116865468 /NCGR_PEP_ID=MMETSP0418-20121206/25452_1 /TAXON_ID=1158023 /ORGANISM="Astrosyne radiata, Strain 13vi08-1A" /LENGTH=245 /DNA_ID=CAMNT_0004500919 /DNA_START=6 /DNA_END=743 /DNA_ORIENTATION=+
MGREILRLLSLHQEFVQQGIWTHISKEWIVHVLGWVAVWMGCSTYIAVVLDVLHVATLHIFLLAAVFGWLFAMELRLMGSLWRLFRGKKKNALRHRTDTMHYDSMQLLLGTVLFTVVLFLFTTVLVYYAFFAVAHLLLVQAPVVMLWMSFVLVKKFPIGKCILRSQHPDWFTERVYLKQSEKLKHEVVWLEKSPCSYSTVIGPFVADSVRSILQGISAGLWGVLRGFPCVLSQRRYVEPAVSRIE